MLKYILKRLLYMIPVIICVSLIIFVVMDAAPSDAAQIIASGEATQEEINTLREQMGLNDPLLVRYFKYMFGLLRGSLGVSYVTGRDVLQTYLQKLPATAELSFAGIFVAIVIAIPLGMLAALRRGTFFDGSAMVFALLGLSMPAFWLGLLLILLFSLQLGWLPSSGASGFQSLILPALTVGAGQAALITRTTRSSMLEVIRSDYVRTARAKGVSRRVAVRKHALRNALIPIITVIGVQIGATLGGAVLTETVFGWPGIGRLIIDSIGKRDVPMVTGCIVMTTVLVSILLLLVDILYAYIDPRIKSQYH